MLFRFSDCLLDTDRRELKRGTQAISVGPQVFDLLVYLLKNRDRVVSKDDVLAAIWRGRTVSQSTLTSHVNAVRKALGDTGADQRLIRTIARKGFRRQRRRFSARSGRRGRRASSGARPS